MAVSACSKEANLQMDLPGFFFHSSAQHFLLHLLTADVQREGQEMLLLNLFWAPSPSLFCSPWLIHCDGITVTSRLALALASSGEVRPDLS